MAATLKQKMIAAERLAKKTGIPIGQALKQIEKHDRDNDERRRKMAEERAKKKLENL